MSSTQKSNEKKLTVLLLIWLFGLFSVHRFYTGKYISGGLQLLSLLIAGVFGALEIEIPGIVAGSIGVGWLIVDLMRIIMGKFTDKEGRPITDWV